jgi:uracil-DNA glycosylase
VSDRNRAEGFVEIEPYYESAAPLVPEEPSIEAVRRAAGACQACHLWRNATRTVFGEGRRHAPIMLVGEQPGDQEDLLGKPFVGPAGRLLDGALREAGIRPEDVYTTNAVKHFKWTPKGKRRLHQKPNRQEVAACRPWLEAEIRLVAPKIVLCLGATAAQAVIDPKIKVTQFRGKVVRTPEGLTAMATVHPSSILRQPDEDARAVQRVLFVGDLILAREYLASLS